MDMHPNSKNTGPRGRSAPRSGLPLRPCAALLLRRESDGRWLLVKKPRLNHAWQFPQGGVEAGETPAQAAAREFHEEVGTQNFQMDSEVRGVFRYRYPPNAVFPDWVKDKQQFGGQEVSLFSGTFTGSQTDIRINEIELAGFAWVTPEELPRYIQDRRYLALCQKIISSHHAR